MTYRHVLWNLIGLGLPLIIAALTIPHLLELIGQERFGLLALAWGLIGYASALDLGIGRAVTQRISKLRGNEGFDEIPLVLATAERLTLLSGLVGMVLISLAALFDAYSFFSVASIPDTELKAAMLLLALALPLQAMSATFRGVNEAYLNFKTINLLRVALGVTNFLGPFLIAFYSIQIQYLVASLVVSRVLALWFYRKSAYDCAGLTSSKLEIKYSRSIAKKLFQFGSWFTISSIVGTLMVQADRFFVGAMISTASVTVYVIPYEVVVQSLILVGAITSVAFPEISRTLNVNPVAAKELFRKWLNRVVIMMAFSMGILAYILPELLSLWVGEAVNAESAAVGQILTVGAFFNAIGSMYFALLHAKGYAKNTAKLHILEALLYFVVLIILIKYYGVVGCAIAWSMRIFLDAIALAYMANKLVLVK